MYQGILAAIGDTPLIELQRAIPGAPFRLFAKLESLNPGGSAKDRPAHYILRHALASGRIRPGAVVVESSSGNMGIGLAQACRVYGLRFICVIDPKTAPQNVRLLELYGAEIDWVREPDPVSGEFLQARIARVGHLLSEISGSFWPNQYANEMNSMAHYETTMHEIASVLKGEVDFLFCATSTCGTITGCAEYVRDHGMRTEIIAVDAIGSRIFATEPAPRFILGFGAGFRPSLCRTDLVSRCVHVSDIDCVTGCRSLLRREGLLVGGSSGGVLAAVERLRDVIPPGAQCVMILADRGERYLDTVYSDDWVCEHLGLASFLELDQVSGRSFMELAQTS
jgi:N-(2-amino-2-carboxyethyl)-L-glutamate synthase